MRGSIYCHGVVFVLLVGVLIWGARAQESEGSPSVGDNNQETWATLQRPISVSYQEELFKSVLSDLADQTRLQFLVHESAIENNLDDEQLISFALEGTRTATCLDLMLGPFQCTYSIQDGIVLILSEDASLDRLSRRVFDCRELLATIKPKRELINYSSGGRVIGGFGGGQFSIDPKPKTGEQDSERKPQASGPAPTQPAQVAYREISPSEQLLELIREMVDPDSWTVAGGAGRIFEVNGMIVVRQTEFNLREIERLMTEITPQNK